MAIVPTIQKLGIFVQISNVFWQYGIHLFRFLMVQLPDFRSYLKTRPFAPKPLFNHSKSRLFWISDPHCLLKSSSCRNLLRRPHLENGIDGMVFKMKVSVRCIVKHLVEGWFLIKGISSRWWRISIDLSSGVPVLEEIRIIICLFHCKVFYI